MTKQPWDAEGMRTPSRRPRRRQVCDTQNVDLDAIAERVSYVGSAEHKTYPFTAGRVRALTPPNATPTTTATLRSSRNG